MGDSQKKDSHSQETDSQNTDGQTRVTQKRDTKSTWLKPRKGQSKDRYVVKEQIQLKDGWSKEGQSMDKQLKEGQSKNW